MYSVAILLRKPSIFSSSGLGLLSICSFYSITFRFFTLFLSCTTSGCGFSVLEGLECGLFSIVFSNIFWLYLVLGSLSKNSANSGSGLLINITATNNSKCFFTHSHMGKLGSVRIRFLFANLMVKPCTNIYSFCSSSFFTKQFKNRWSVPKQ